MFRIEFSRFHALKVSPLLFLNRWVSFRPNPVFPIYFRGYTFFLVSCLFYSSFVLLLFQFGSIKLLTHFTFTWIVICINCRVVIMVPFFHWFLNLTIFYERNKSFSFAWLTPIWHYLILIYDIIDPINEFLIISFHIVLYYFFYFTLEFSMNLSVIFPSFLPYDLLLRPVARLPCYSFIVVLPSEFGSV